MFYCRIQLCILKYNYNKYHHDNNLKKNLFINFKFINPCYNSNIKGLRINLVL